MKKSLAFFVLLFLGTVITANTAKAQTVSFCIHDAFGYTWTGTVTVTGNKYSGKGKVDIGSGTLWRGKIKGTSGASATLTATNPLADGCASGYTDYFVYSGTAQAGLFYGTEFRFDGSGTWNSYCSGVIANSGTWSARDCFDLGARTKISKEGPATHVTASLIKVSPNPINGQANISYSVAQSGKVNITIYNSMQQAVKVLVNDFKNAGNYSAVWDTKSSNVNAGIYRVVAILNNKTYTSTVQVVR
jgi:hypothetical protein